MRKDRTMWDFDIWSHHELLIVFGMIATMIGTAVWMIIFENALKIK